MDNSVNFDRKTFMSILKLLKNEVQKYCCDAFCDGNQLNQSKKPDNSIVTEMDYFISNKLKELIRKNDSFSHINFFSEEDLGSFNFPCFIVDPIDGTKDLVAGNGECVISICYMHSPKISDSENFAWIYNPFTGFEIHSEMTFYQRRKQDYPRLTGMVSKSECRKGMFNLEEKKVLYIPKGSIANKLALLAVGACDFVNSRRGKHVWDIAAGTVLLHQRGLKFFEQGKEIHTLDRQEYEKNLLWCFEEHFKDLIKV